MRMSEKSSSTAAAAAAASARKKAKKTRKAQHIAPPKMVRPLHVLTTFNQSDHSHTCALVLGRSHRNRDAKRAK